MIDYFTTEEFYNAYFYLTTTAFTTMLCTWLFVACAKTKKTTRKTQESDQGIVLTNQVPQEKIPDEARSSEDPKRPRNPVPPPNIPVAPAVRNDHTLREVESIKADKSG